MADHADPTGGTGAGGNGVGGTGAGGIDKAGNLVVVRPYQVSAAKLFIKTAERTGRSISPAIRKIAEARPLRRSLAD